MIGTGIHGLLTLDNIPENSVSVPEHRPSGNVPSSTLAPGTSTIPLSRPVVAARFEQASAPPPPPAQVPPPPTLPLFEGSDPRSATDTEPSQSRQPTPPANATEPSPAPTPKVAAAKVATSEADTPKQTSLPKKPERDRENVDSPPVTSDSPAPRKPPDREAILSLGEDSYVVQLLASKRERDATRLLDRWNLRDRAFHIRGTHKGATLYLVLSYPVTGFSEARKVLQALPEELRDKGAWIRGADGIKRMVR